MFLRSPQVHSLSSIALRFFVLLAALAPLTELQAQSGYVLTTIAGTKGLAGNADGVGPAVRFGNAGGNITCNGVALDGSGNVYVADRWNNTIRKVAPDGTSSTIAGNAAQPPGTADGTGSAARFTNPSGIAVDHAGMIYVTDASTVRKISPAGVVTTLAPAAGFLGANGVAVDLSGNVFVADTLNNSIRKITADGTVTTIAGGLAQYAYGQTDGPGATARFFRPEALAVDSTGTIYVADTGNSTIRKISPGGEVTTLAGWAGFYGYADGEGAAARFSYPRAIAVDGAGIVYVGDNNAIRKITSDGTVTTVSGVSGLNSTVDGNGSAVRFSYIVGMAMDGAGVIYVTDCDTHTCVLRKAVPPNPLSPMITLQPAAAITGAGTQAEFRVMAAGTPGTFSYRWQRAPFGSTNWSDLPEADPFHGTTTAILTVTGTSTGMTGDLYRCIIGNSIGPAVASAAALLTVIPVGTPFYSGNEYRFTYYSTGMVDGTALSYGLAVCVDAAGNVYFSDEGRCIVLKKTPAGDLSLLAGSNGNPGYADGVGAAARFAGPVGLAADQAGNIYVAEQTNRTIRKITPAGVVTTLAGSPGQWGTVNGMGSNARFSSPTAITVDSAGNVYVADYYQAGSNPTTTVIREITPDGNVTTFAGSYSLSDPTVTGDSTGRLLTVFGLAADVAGNLYAVDWYDNRVKKISRNGTITTIAGSGVMGDKDGQGTDAQISQPLSIAVDAAGFVYATEGNEIRKISPTGAVTTLLNVSDGTHGISQTSYYGIAVNHAGVIYCIDNHGLASESFEAVYQIRPGNTGPVITTQPASQVVSVGRTVTFTAAATGTPGPTYQWWKNGEGIPGATDSSYTIASAQASDRGAYTLVATNSEGTVTSNAANLTVNTTGADFNGDGNPDILLENAATGQRVLWLMGGPNNAYVSQGLDLGALDPAWQIVATADFNGDGAPDVLLENTATGQRVLWLMGGPNNAYVTQGLDLGVLDPTWHIVGTADFNGDGKPDILLENTVSGQRVLWLMGGPNNAYVTQGLDLGVLDPSWHIVGLADFNGDGAPDVLLENTTTGQRVLWLMGGPNNAYVTQGLDLGVLDPVWHIVYLSDFNGDGAPDILLENLTTGQRVLWLMGGPNNAYVTQGLDLGVLDPVWHIVE